MQWFLSLPTENSGCRDQAAIAVAPLPVRDSTCKMPRQSQVPCSCREVYPESEGEGPRPVVER